MSPLPTGEGGVWPRFVVYGIPAACLVAAAALGHDTGRRDSPLTRLGEAVGDASYALYLVHPFVIRGLREALTASRLGVSMAAWAFVAIALVAAVASAFAVYRLFERPMTRALRRMLEPAARPTRAAGEY
jgi:peptidoglycan/LPS O-acetylase OafA/YrhL